MVFTLKLYLLLSLSPPYLLRLSLIYMYIVYITLPLQETVSSSSYLRNGYPGKDVTFYISNNSVYCTGFIINISKEGNSCPWKDGLDIETITLPCLPFTSPTTWLYWIFFGRSVSLASVVGSMNRPFCVYTENHYTWKYGLCIETTLVFGDLLKAVPSISPTV